MQFICEKGGEVEIVLVKEGEDIIPTGQKLYSYLKAKELFKAELGEVYFDVSMLDTHTLYVGLGKEKDIHADSLREAFFQAGKELMKHKVENVGCRVPILNEISFDTVIQSLVEGLLQSEYAFEKHLKVKKVIKSLKNVYLEVDNSQKEAAESLIKETENIIDGIFFARDLVNERAIDMYPEVLAQIAKENLEPLGVNVEIFDEKRIKELHMDSFLSVAKGSDKEPRFIVMSYNGNGEKGEKLALVGKGITYDSGGYSLKPSNSMETMFCDMAGSATVIGTMMSIAKSKLKKCVVGIVAACENLISGSAYKPGDIIGSMAGKTIEINNTDAEGRLTLADALYYAATVVKADKIIDVATLTGACVVALGSSHSGAVTNNDELMSALKKSSSVAGEPIWQLPSGPDYKKLLKGDFADLKNAPGRDAGAITAGLFLEEFVNGTPFVHLDIAGTAYLDKPSRYLPKGATGVHVKTFYHFVKEEL